MAMRMPRMVTHANAVALRQTPSRGRHPQWKLSYFVLVFAMSLSHLSVRKRLLLLGAFTNALLVAAVCLGALASWRMAQHFEAAAVRQERIVEAAGAARDVAEVKSLAKLGVAELKRAAAQAESERLRMIALLALVTAGTLVVSAVVGIANERSIVPPLEGMVRIARSVSGGDLTTRIENGRRDEMGDVLRSLSEMNASLLGVVKRVKHASQSMMLSASRIAARNNELSARTESEASSLEQTAASIEQMTATVDQNAGHAKRANELAGNAAAVAQTGGELVLQMVGRMEEIQERSRRISEITTLIDSIAFQTNILALNAAVEAARAGESGRGFAVVATEVRQLARRSAEAARQIRELIAGAVAAVSAGAALADDAGRTMGTVTASANDVRRIVAEIATASAEQQAGIGQINTAIMQLDRVTQENAAMAHDSTEASRELQRTAEELERAVGYFKLEAADEPRLAQVLPARPALSRYAGSAGLGSSRATA